MTRNLRSYSWDTAHALRLLEDIRDFEPKDDDDIYDLGQVIPTASSKADLTDHGPA
jgi:hypothetical protein